MEQMALVLLVGSVALSFLPASPFQLFISQVEKLPYLGFINYFIPIDFFLSVGQAWLIAITIFYLASVVLRWVKMIGD